MKVNKRCPYCNQMLEEGKIVTQALSATGISYALTRFIKGSKRITLQNKNNAYYCENCKKVIVEYSIN